MIGRPNTWEDINSLAQTAALIVGGWWALGRFGFTRESRTFLDLSTRRYLALDPAGGGAMDDLIGYSITYRSRSSSDFCGRRGQIKEAWCRKRRLTAYSRRRRARVRDLRRAHRPTTD